MNNVFPTLEHNWNQDLDHWQYELTGGLTKRELFAAMAMQGLAPHYAQGSDSMANCVAKLAVENADALLAELAKQPVG